MRVTMPIIAVGATLAAYAAYPCLTLYRLDCAVNDGNAADLKPLVNWGAVRAGINEDIAGKLAGDADARAVASGDELAPFGFSFARQIAAKAVATTVAPERLLAVLRRAGGEAGGGSRLALRSAALEAPTRIRLGFGLPRQAGTLRVRMELQHGVWKITRVWLPPALLREARADDGGAAAGRLAARTEME